MLGKALNYLAENKESQEKLRAEIKNQDNQITFDELHQLPYLDAVFNGKILNKKIIYFYLYFSRDVFVSKETLRLSPFPFPLWKTCTESVELTDYNGKTLLVEKGTKLILPINALHSHPDYYGNPEKFDPDRFNESKGGIKRLKDAGVFMPFGNGPRQCLGKFRLKVENSLKTLKARPYIFS